MSKEIKTKWNVVVPVGAEDEPDRQPSVQLRPTEPWRVEEGGSVTLQCVVTGTSTRPVITWLKEHSNKSRYWPREHGTNVTVIPPGNQSSEWISNLTIDHVIAEDAGTYVCRAKNGVGLGPPSEAARELVVVPVNVIQAPNSDSSDTSPFSAAALDWGLVAIVIFAGVVLVGCLWLVRSRIRKSHINHHERCPAMNHGKNGDEECICGEVEFDIFISYNSNDKEWVNNVLREGLSNSYKVCMDSVDFEPGKYITDNIAHNIWVSRKILLVISRNFLKSEWCCYEKQIAQGKVILYRDSLIVIMLENLKTEELPKDLRHYKLEKTYLEWDNDEVKPHFWKRLNDAIGPSVFRVEDVKEEMV